MAGVLDNNLPVADLLRHRFWIKQEKYGDESDGASVASVGVKSHKAERIIINSGVISIDLDSNEVGR